MRHPISHLSVIKPAIHLQLLHNKGPIKGRIVKSRDECRIYVVDVLRECEYHIEFRLNSYYLNDFVLFAL
jgi:hypothetical protein